ncbi:MAG TPA: LysE family translocator [Noviherbaspirillum sp.]|uniref:LysE family translocator n=1 Tax=Noviherbaspirillum sp. TaxID=1926288 RepID=UPI002F95935A
MDPTVLLMYLAALAGVYLLPGPDMALVVATAGARGARTALVTAAGIALSRAVHVLLSGVGLAALLAARPGMLEAVKIVGAAYLLYIAFQLLRADARQGAGHAAPAPAPARAYLLRGFLTNLLNPKALLFCSLFLPQFVHPDAGPLPLQYLVLGLVLVMTGLAFDAAYALSASRIGRRVRLPSRLGRFVLPAVFVALAGRLVAG